MLLDRLRKQKTTSFVFFASTALMAVSYFSRSWVELQNNDSLKLLCGLTIVGSALVSAISLNQLMSSRNQN